MGAIIIFAWCIVGGVLAAVLFNAGMHVAWIWTLGMVWGYILFFIMYHVTPRKFPTPKWIKAIWEHIWPTEKLRHPKDFREHPYQQAYIVPVTVYCRDKVLYIPGDVLSFELALGMYNVKYIGYDRACKMVEAWRYKLPELSIEPCSEQSVILPKMDEIADPFAEDYAKSHSDRFAIIDKVPKRMFESMGIYYPNNGIGEWNGVKHDWKQNYKGITPSTVDETGKPLDDDLYKYVGYNLYNSNTDIYGPRLVFKNGEAYPLSYIKDKIKPEEFDKTLKRLFKKV